MIFTILKIRSHKRDANWQRASAPSCRTLICAVFQSGKTLYRYRHLGHWRIHAAGRGGVVSRVRDVEAFGVFYALDQIRMWKGLRDAGGLANYVGSWFAGDVSQAAMMNPHRAVAMVLEVMLDKLASAGNTSGQNNWISV